MAISLYDVSVASYLQVLGAVSGFVDRGLAYAKDKAIDPTELVETRLYPDMHPLSFQVVSVAHHSLGAIEGVKAGVFTPPSAPWPKDYAGLQAVVAEARAGLQALKADDINALEGRDVTFQFGEMKIPFVAEHFILSFSLPNFYFHATTAYDILRSKGAPLGKRHFTGALRTKA